MTQDRKYGLLIGRDIPWITIKGHILLVLYFLKLAHFEDHKVKDISKLMPYGTLEVAYPETLNVYKGTKLTLPILHRLDFKHFWELYEERGITSEEEVTVTYEPQEGWRKIFGGALPNLRIEVSPKGSLNERVYVNQANVPPTSNWTEFMRRTEAVAEWDPMKGRVK